MYLFILYTNEFHMKKSMKTSIIYMYLFILYTDEFDDKYVSVKTCWKFLMRTIEFP